MRTGRQALTPPGAVGTLPAGRRAHPTLEFAFPYAIQGEDHAVTESLTRLRHLTRNGDYAYYTDIAH
ncbi:hypothetical protein [Streptomyces sp. MP131-18]|uniref:hypothetical protein n=1 Tax=Streptomyces sp. MP131-18 TaxID=1857892 RepID=UPI00097C9952|nr:hypothetical protein [Streptomyces sp. MP131-18]ONK11646.1 hypothetical protein STBA_23810 [Streptomyces sp. MP131-18]